MQKSKVNNLSLQSILDTQLSSEKWPLLEEIIKLLEESTIKSAKNRDYLMSQKCQEKITEAKNEVKKRNLAEIETKMGAQIEELEAKQQHDSSVFEKEWGKRLKKIEDQNNDVIIKKIQKQNEEREKYLQQIQTALPQSHSPDHDLHRLRYEEEHCAREGRFMEAQKMKDRIEEKEAELNEKHKKIREANIAMMIKDLEAKHHNEVAALERRKEERVAEAEREKKKKQKDLFQKACRERREVRWIYNEEMKRFS